MGTLGMKDIKNLDANFKFNDNLIMLRHIDYVIERLEDFKHVAVKNQNNPNFCGKVASLLLETEYRVHEAEESVKEVKQDGVY